MQIEGIRVHHATLDRAVVDMQQTVREIDERLDRLERELAPLRSDWHGRAQEAYHQAKAIWDDAIRQMRELLDESRATVFQSNAEYQAADHRGAAQFQAGG